LPEPANLDGFGDFRKAVGSEVELRASSHASFRKPKGYLMAKTTKDSSQQPVHKIRHGAVSAGIWRQETAKGPMFNVTFQRAYRDGDTWKYSESFGRKDLLVVSLIAARAFEWIANQTQKAKPSSQSPKTGDDVPF
jgi:hypothetical protein